MRNNNKNTLFLITIILSVLLPTPITAQINKKDKPIPQLVGSSEDNSKEVVILWQMPEKANSRDIFLLQNIPLLRMICKNHSYSLVLTSDGVRIGDTLPELTKDVINPSAQQIELLATSLTRISNAEVLAFFTHGHSDIFRDGIFLGCYVTAADADKVLAKIQQNNSNLHKYLFKAELQDSKDYHYNEPWTIMLNLDAITNKVIPVSNTMINNGILYMNICHSDVFKNVFNNLGASTIISALTTEQTDYLMYNFLFTMSCMFGEMETFKHVFSISDSQIINAYLDINEGFSRGDMISKSSIVIDPPTFDYNKTRSLLRSPHIEEIKISNAKKSDEAYYHYLYSDAYKYNPAEPYPGDNVLNVANSIGKYEEILKSGLLQKPIPKDAKLKIYISFSKPIKDSMLSNKSIKAKLSFFYKEEIGDIYEEQNFEITVPSSNDKNDVDTMRNSNLWIGSIDLGNKENSDKLSIVKDKIFRAILMISYKDPQKKDKNWYLDTNGDGKWEDGIGRKDGAKIDNDYYDNNHWLLFEDIPKFTVRNSEISKLHLPLIKCGPPPKELNAQPLASDGFIVYPEKEYERFAPCYSTLPNNVSSTYCIMDVSQQISSEYMPAFYLNKELLESAQVGDQKKIIGELPDGDAAITSLKTTNYPSYVANLRTEATGQKGKQDQCVPLSAAGEDVSTLKPFISLKMKNYQFVKGNGSRGENYPGSKNTEVDLSDKYDLYTVKGNPCDIVVSLPLKRIFGENIEAYEGKNVLRLETTNGGMDAGREVYSSQSLEFIKSIQTPVNEGAVHGSRRFHRVSDPVSGFDNNHITEWIANRSTDPKVGGYVFNMAHNLLDLGPLPETSPTSKAAPAPKDESAGGGEIPESEGTPDNGYYADWTPNRGWIQEHQLSIDYASVGCYYKKIWRSVDFAVMYNPKPVVSPVQICEVWRIFKKANVSCQSGEIPPNNQTISVTCQEVKSDSNPKKKETEDSDNKDKDEDNPENTQTTNTSTGDGDKNNSDKKPASPPVIDNITAVKDKTAYNHVALKIDWSDADSDINIYSARVFLINPLNPGFFRELDISSDMDSGYITSSGCILRNIPEFKEGFFLVKAYIQDQSGLYTTKVKNLLVNIEEPLIHKPFIKDAENKTVTAELSDEGTPVSDWKIKYDKDYTLIPNDRFSATFTAYIPEQITQGESRASFNLKTTDLAGNEAQENLYADLYGPQVGVDYQDDEKLLVSNQLDIDLNSGGIDPYRTELNIDGFIHQGDYKINLVNGEYRITYPAYKLPEGDHVAYAKACDYDNNCTTSDTLQFRVAWPPEIYYFDYNVGKSNDPSYFEAKVWDKGKNLDPNGFDLNIDGGVVPRSAYSYDPASMLFYYYPTAPFVAGSHTATLVARDTTGLFDTETISFKSAGITDLILTNKNYRDIEGNGDGIINEAERIYIDLEVTNKGDASTQNTWGELISRSEYIKGVAEGRARYGFIQPGATAFNDKPFEFVVNSKVFERDDIDRVEAEFVLRLTEIDYYSGASKTTDLPFTLVIERMDPAMALFEISVIKPSTQTLEPMLRLEGSWKTFGTNLKNLDIRITQDSLPASTARNSLAVFQNDLTVVKNDSKKTFYADAVLGIGDNRFVVTAAADNGVVRTAEVSVKLLSQVGIKLDAIGDTRDPNVIVTGNAWTVNSKLEKVEIYLNGGLVGDAVVESGGRFSLPVTLNGGENIIRAVARDDQGKSALDEIKINMHGPLTLRWQRAHWRTTVSPVAACGSYEVEGEDIASIVTYVNNTPNTYEVVIDRNLKTFCTKAALQPGNNLLRAVGTTTGGVTAEAFSRVEYNTGGVLSIEFDSLPPQGVSNFNLTGRFTLRNNNPYTITVHGPYIYDPWHEYIPVINHTARTFSVNVTLSDPPIGCGDGDCCCQTDYVQFEGKISQDIEEEYNWIDVIQINAVCSDGLTYVDPGLCTTGKGSLEGNFYLNAPGAHIAGIELEISTDDNTYFYTVIDYNEIIGTWHLNLDISPDTFSGIARIYPRITDTFGNWFMCISRKYDCDLGASIIKPTDSNHKHNKRKCISNPDRKHSPKRAVDGTRE